MLLNLQEKIVRYFIMKFKAYDFYFKFIDRKRVVSCHKAGVMKRGDGLFINVCKKISSEYPDIEYTEE